MAKQFEVPWTINDEDESGFWIWYLTRSEFGLAMLSVMVWYAMLLPVYIPIQQWKGAGLLHGGLSVLGVILFVTWMTKYKKGKPSSWLWDALLALGTLSQQRGLMHADRGIRWLSMHHLPSPSVFLTGSKRSGEDLTVSAPWMTHMQPVVAWAPLCPPRRKRVFSNEASPAPAWFHGANGFEDVVNPRIPVSVKHVVVPEEIPNDADDDETP